MGLGWINYSPENGMLYAAAPSFTYSPTLKYSKMQEVFKDIEGYEGLYQVSKLGKVKSLERKKEHLFIKAYDSLTDASLKTRLDISHISKVCRGKRKYAGGFIWSFKV